MTPAAKSPPVPLHVALLRNFGSSLGSRLGTTLIGVMTFAVLARSLGADGLGEYRTVLTLLLFAGVAFDFGLYAITLREMSRPEYAESEILGNAITLRIFGTALATILLSIGAEFIESDTAVRQGILIASVGWVAFQLSELLRGVFQLKLAQQTGAVAELTGALATLLLVMIAAGLHAGTNWMLAATAAGFCCTTVLAWRFAGRLVPLHMRFDPKMWRGLILAGLPLAGSAVLQTVQLRIDLLFLAVMRPTVDVGLYNAPLKLYELLYAIPYLFGGLMVPFFVRDWDSGRGSMAPRVNAALAATLIFSALSFGVLYVCATPVLLIIAGKAFTQAADSLRILVLSAGFVGATCILRLGALSMDKQASMLRADVIGVCVAIVAHLLLIPRYGIVGAATGKLCGDAATCFAAAFVMRSELNRTSIYVAMCSAVGSAVLIGALSLIDIDGVPLLLASIGGGLLFLLAVVLLPPVKRRLAGLLDQHRPSAP